LSSIKLWRGWTTETNWTNGMRTMSETIVTRENLDEALIILRRVLDEQIQESPKTRKQRLQEILKQVEALEQRLKDMESSP